MAIRTSSPIARALLAVLLATALSPPPSAQAAASVSDCSPRFRRLVRKASDYLRPPAIARNPRAVPVPEKVLDPEILRGYVRVYDPRDPAQVRALAELREGTYVYVDDNRGRFAVLNRAVPIAHGERLPAPPARSYPQLLADEGHPSAIPIARPDEAFVGAHESLVNYLNWLDARTPSTKPPLEIFGAGEVQIRHGRGNVALVSNGSGTYPGGRANLDYSVTRMRRLGLRVGKGTEIRDLSVGKYPDPHSTVVDQVRRELHYAARPELQTLLDESRAAAAAYFRGHSSVEALIDRYLKRATEPGCTEAEDELMSRVIYFLNMSRNLADSEVDGVDSLLTITGNPEGFREVLRSVRHAAETGDFF